MNHTFLVPQLSEHFYVYYFADADIECGSCVEDPNCDEQYIDPTICDEEGGEESPSLCSMKQVLKQFVAHGIITLIGAFYRFGLTSVFPKCGP